MRATATTASDRWTARPVLGAALRVLALLGPVLVGVAAAVVLTRLLPTPDALLPRLGWWAAVLGGSVAAAYAADRLARRLLPLAVLLELSLVFPDRAPSRLRASRTSSVRDLDDRLARLRSAGVPMEPYEAAETLVTLVGILGLHDKRTRGHSERVRAFTDLLTEELGLPEDDRQRLRWAALVHDLGKLSVPAAVLNSPAGLEPDEWHVVRRHPEEGERLVAGLLPWLGEWGATVVQHHERYDGTGYPQGLAGEQIAYGARIVSVCDSFEVMTSSRSYSPARSAAAGRAELARCAGTQFDPAVVRAFLGISLGRLHWVLGPVTWLAQLPFVAAADRAGQAVKAGAVTAVVGGMVGAGVLPGPSTDPDPRPPAVAAPAPAVSGSAAPPGAGAPPQVTGVAGGLVPVPRAVQDPLVPGGTPDGDDGTDAAPDAPEPGGLDPVAPDPTGPEPAGPDPVPAPDPAEEPVPAPTQEPTGAPTPGAPTPDPTTAPTTGPTTGPTAGPTTDPTPAPSPSPDPTVPPPVDEPTLPPSPTTDPPPPTTEPSTTQPPTTQPPTTAPPPDPAPTTDPPAEPSATPTPTPTPTATPSPTPDPQPVATELRRFLAPTGLAAEPPAPGERTVPRSGTTAFDSAPLAAPLTVTGEPSVTLVRRYTDATGNAAVDLALLDCPEGGADAACTLLATGTAPNNGTEAARADTVALALETAAPVVAPGRVLRLVLTRPNGSKGDLLVLLGPVAGVGTSELVVSGVTTTTPVASTLPLGPAWLPLLVLVAGAAALRPMTRR